MTESALPAGWQRVRLGDLIDGFEAGRNLRAHGRAATGSEFGVLKLSAVSWGTFRPEENKALLEGDTPRPREIVCKGDLLISRANTSELVGAVVRVDGDHPRLMLPDKVLRLRVRSSVVDPAFLLHALRTRQARKHLEENASGTSDSMRNLSQPKMEATPLLLPPLNEQRRIVAKLEALQSRSRRAREALDPVPPLLGRLRQSILAAAFRGDLTKDWRAKHKDVEPATELLKRIRIERRKKWEDAELAKMTAKGKRPTDDKWKAKYKDPEPVDATALPELPVGWCWASLDELCPGDAPAVYGIILPGDDVPQGVPYVRPIDIREDGTVDFDSIKRTTAEIASQYARASLRTGDVVLSIVGTIGKVLVVPPGLNGGNITQSSARIRPPPGMASDYIGLALRSPWLTRQFDKFRFGNAVQRLNVEHVRQLGIPLAPHIEQAVVVQRAETALGAVPGALLAKLKLQIGVLHGSILAKAFRGALVQQDPSDEPADARGRAVGASAHGTPNRVSRRRTATMDKST